MAEEAVLNGWKPLTKEGESDFREGGTGRRIVEARPHSPALLILLVSFPVLIGLSTSMQEKRLRHLVG